MPIYLKSGTGQILLTSGWKVAGGSACCCGGTAPGCPACTGGVPFTLDAELSGMAALAGECSDPSLVNGLYSLEASDTCKWSGSGPGGPCEIGSIVAQIIPTGGSPTYLIQGLVSTIAPDASPPFVVQFSAFLDAATDCAHLDVTLANATALNTYYDSSGATLRLFVP